LKGERFGWFVPWAFFGFAFFGCFFFFRGGFVAQTQSCTQFSHFWADKGRRLIFFFHCNSPPPPPPMVAWFAPLWLIFSKMGFSVWGSPFPRDFVFYNTEKNTKKPLETTHFFFPPLQRPFSRFNFSSPGRGRLGVGVGYSLKKNQNKPPRCCNHLSRNTPPPPPPPCWRTLLCHRNFNFFFLPPFPPWG